MSKLVDLREALANRRTVGLFDDFIDDLNTTRWISTLTDSGTNAVGDAQYGIVVLTPSDVTVADNDEAYLESANETFLFAASKPLIFEARVLVTEAGSNNALNIFAGLVDAVGANLLVDNGAGPKTTASGVAIFKVDGSSVWKCWSSKSNDQTTTTSTKTASSSSYQVLRIEVHDFSDTECQVLFFVDGEQLLDTNGKPIVHKVILASATEMQIGFGIKNGEATTVETLSVDYATAYQLRPQ